MSIGGCILAFPHDIKYLGKTVITNKMTTTHTEVILDKCLCTTQCTLRECQNACIAYECFDAICSQPSNCQNRRYETMNVQNNVKLQKVKSYIDQDYVYIHIRI